MVFNRILTPHQLEAQRFVASSPAKAFTADNQFVARAPSPRQVVKVPRAAFKDLERRDGPPSSMRSSSPRVSRAIPHAARDASNVDRRDAPPASSRSSPFPRDDKSANSKQSPLAGSQATAISQIQKQKQQKQAVPVLDPIEKLKNSLSKFSRSNDRRMMIRTIASSPLLQDIQLGALSDFSMDDPEEMLSLQNEVASSKLTINGVIVDGLGVKSPSLYMEFLSKLCNQTTQHSTISSQELFQALLPRIAPSSSVNEVYFRLNDFVGSPDLVLQSPKTCAILPTDMQLYCDGINHHVHARITTKHPFGLFRKSDLAKGSKQRPWIRLIVTVEERVNLSTCDSVRLCSVHVYDKH
ncbi:hypothetical protein MPSEU_001033900 [Mayamaea pseudoterrestris]|nr:hypothetical protein MPSEU_001033900 [Mayamaea pseudoterrestris]